MGPLAMLVPALCATHKAWNSWERHDIVWVIMMLAVGWLLQGVLHVGQSGGLCGRLRAVPLRSVTSKFGRTGDSELTERGTGERWEEEGLPSLLNQTCSGNSAHHQRRQLVKNKLICHLITNNSASICSALNSHGLLSTANVCFSS